jgi:hypothetical protein
MVISTSLKINTKLEKKKREEEEEEEKLIQLGTGGSCL